MLLHGGNDRSVPYLRILTAAVIWGSIGVAGRAVFGAGVDPLETAFYRAAIAFLTIAAAVAVWNRPLLRVRAGDLWLFVAFGAAFSMFAWGLAAAVAMCGYYLHVQRRYLFCIIVAAIETLNMPFGTVLGVFTIVTLADAQGKAMFERSIGPEPETATPVL